MEITDILLGLFMRLVRRIRFIFLKKKVNACENFKILKLMWQNKIHIPLKFWNYLGFFFFEKNVVLRANWF